MACESAIARSVWNVGRRLSWTLREFIDSPTLRDVVGYRSINISSTRFPGKGRTVDSPGIQQREIL